MMALGKPVKYQDMRKAHVHLVSNGLGDIHFDAIARHLDAALNDHGIDEQVRKEVARVRNCALMY